MIIWLASVQPLQITAFKAKVMYHQCKHSLFHNALCSVWPDRSSDCWLHWDVEETDLYKEWGSNYSISLLIFLHQLFHYIWLSSPGEVIAMCLLFLITLQSISANCSKSNWVSLYVFFYYKWWVKCGLIQNTVCNQCFLMFFLGLNKVIMILQPMKDQYAFNLKYLESEGKQYIKANCCNSFWDVQIHHFQDI